VEKAQEHVEEAQKVEPVNEPKLEEASKNVFVVHAIRDRSPLHDALLEKTLEAIKSTRNSITATDLSKFTVNGKFIYSSKQLNTDADITNFNSQLVELGVLSMFT
jgi:hypothetical protein